MKASYTNQPDYDQKPWKGRFYRESPHGYFRFFHGDTEQHHRKRLVNKGILPEMHWKLRVVNCRVVHPHTLPQICFHPPKMILFMAEIGCIQLFTCFCTRGDEPDCSHQQHRLNPTKSSDTLPSSRQSVLQETVVTSRSILYIALKKQVGWRLVRLVVGSFGTTKWCQG